MYVIFSTDKTCIIAFFSISGVIISKLRFLLSFRVFNTFSTIFIHICCIIVSIEITPPLFIFWVKYILTQEVVISIFYFKNSILILHYHLHKYSSFPFLIKFLDHPSLLEKINQNPRTILFQDPYLKIYL